MAENNQVTVVPNPQDGQLQVYDMSTILSMPKDQFIEFFLQPVQDDTWIRQEDIVKMEAYIDSPEGEEIKKEILREYIEKRAAEGIKREDKVLEGMAYQEKVMEDYLLNHKGEVSQKVSSYREFIMSNFRRRHPDFKATEPFGEEVLPDDKESSGSDDDAAKPEKKSVDPATNTADTKNEEPQEAQPAEEEAVAEEPKEDEAKADEPAEEAAPEVPPQEEQPNEEEPKGEE